MNKIRIFLIAFALLMAGGVSAQKILFTPMGGDGNVQCVKISTKSIWRGCPTLSYERTLNNRNGSLEGTFGWFTSGESNLLHGAMFKAGYKWNIPVGAQSKSLRQKGYLCSGFYIKPEFTYVHRAREYECFAGNNGWNINTEYNTYSDNSTALMLMFGFQINRPHFFFEGSTGIGGYKSGNTFPQMWYYGFTGWGAHSGVCFYNTFKIGFPF